MNSIECKHPRSLGREVDPNASQAWTHNTSKWSGNSHPAHQPVAFVDKQQHVSSQFPSRAMAPTKNTDCGKYRMQNMTS